MELYTDRNGESSPRIFSRIQPSVWNGILMLLEKYKSNNSLSISFPQTCPDNDSIICGFNSHLFDTAIQAYIPKIKNKLNPVSTSMFEFDGILNYESGVPSDEVIMDLLEYVYINIVDFKITGSHSFFGHDHICSREGNNERDKFVNDVNALFQRNSLAYEMKANGKIERILLESESIIINNNAITSDKILNNLINEAFDLIKSTRPSERRNALEKLWDAYERLKTYHSSEGIQKSVSADKVISTLSSSSSAFDTMLHKEFKALTDIGNNFRIRHSEQDKSEFTDDTQIDYLFFRLACVVNLFLSKYNGRP